MRVTFANGQPSAPVTVAGGFDFPTSVTVCVPAQTRVPVPVGKDQGPAVGTVGEPGPGQGSRLEHSGDRRLRLNRCDPRWPPWRPACARGPRAGSRRATGALVARRGGAVGLPAAPGRTRRPPRHRVRRSGRVPAPVSPWDWPGYGHDAQHTFHGRTTLTESSVRTLRQAWFFPTGDAVTATPTVVGGTVYVGLVGRLLLRGEPADGCAALEGPARLAERHHAVSRTATPRRHVRRRPGHLVRLVRAGVGTTAGARHRLGGLHPVRAGGRPRVRSTGSTTTRACPARPTRTTTAPGSSRRPSSWTAASSSASTRTASRGPAATWSPPTSTPGNPVWEFQTDVTAVGAQHVLLDSCGSVWSSGTVLPDLGLVVFGTADCKFVGSAAMPTR